MGQVRLSIPWEGSLRNHTDQGVLVLGDNASYERQGKNMLKLCKTSYGMFRGGIKDEEMEGSGWFGKV